MIDHTPDLVCRVRQAETPDERATWSLILADWWEDRGDCADAATVRRAVESGEDGFAAALSTPSGGAGREAGQLKVMWLKDEELRFRWCPPGSFTMGISREEVGHWGYETQVDVRLTRGFWIAEVPVTQGLWQTAGGPKLDWSSVGAGPRLPVYNVSHYEALAFAESLTKQLRESGELPTCWKLSLPTEAQWEYAARTGTNTLLPWGFGQSRIDEFAWNSRNSGGRPHEVGTLQPNDWGIKDMLGNVSEWCADGWFDQFPGGEDPFVGPEQSPSRACRGGTWDTPARFCLPAVRNWCAPEKRLDFIGFRLALVQSLGEASRRGACEAASKRAEAEACGGNHQHGQLGEMR